MDTGGGTGEHNDVKELANAAVDRLQGCGPVKLPVMRGSIIEILVNRNKLSFIVTNPPDGMEMTWHNTVTVSKPYK